MDSRSLLLAFAITVFSAAWATAQSGDAGSDGAGPSEAAADVLAGHSYHGEAFNEGPRQEAYLMEGLGRVTFPVTTENDRAQQFVTQGVAQLHGFWYFEAERSFRQAAALDPECAMAYWGMAMANRNTPERAKGFIAEASKRKERVSSRERHYIEALDAYLAADPKKQKKERSRKYTKALEELIYEFPDDLEAKAFLVLQLWYNRSDEIPITSYLAVEALIKQILAEEPMHPVHHYQIHLWDYEKPERALRSATLCGQSLPAIAHMWHMPGHTFSRVKRYNDAAWQQEASARVDHAHMMRDGIMPDQIHNFAHNNEWLIRNLNHVGRVWDAVDLAKNMIELPRHPNYNTLEKRGSANYGRTRLLETLERYELWDRLIALCQTPYLDPTENEEEQVKRLRILGQAHFRSGDQPNGQAVLAELKERLEAKREEKKRLDAAKKAEQAADEEASSQDEADESKESSDKNDRPENKAGSKVKAAIRRLEKAVLALEGHAAVNGRDYETGWNKLKKAGNIDPVYVAKIQLLAGHAEDALKAAQKHIDTHESEVQPLGQLVELLWFAEQPAAAKQAFEELRSLSGPIDLDVPLFRRLTPIAQTLGYERDWRVPLQVADDVGNRPDLDSLGVFRWHPSPAPSWELTDSQGERRSLEEFAGQPVLIIFYLGHGCLHCAEQLHEFAPMADRFREAGIRLLAISTDDDEGLQVSAANFEGELPMTLLSNADLDVFHKYRVFDDFEDQPLHGTFLIDGRGLIRWQDISYEPFMDAEFVLQESQRLLAQP